MSCNVVDAGTSREGNAGFKAISLDEETISHLHLVADIHDFHARFNEALSVLSDLPVALCCLPEHVQVIKGHMFLCLQLGISDAVPVVLTSIFVDLTLRVDEVLVHELDPNRYSRWAGLLPLTWSPVPNDPKVTVVLLTRSVHNSCWLILLFVIFLLFLFVTFTLSSFFNLSLRLFFDFFLLLFVLFTFICLLVLLSQLFLLSPFSCLIFVGALA